MLPACEPLPYYSYPDTILLILGHACAFVCAKTVCNSYLGSHSSSWFGQFHHTLVGLCGQPTLGPSSQEHLDDSETTCSDYCVPCWVVQAVIYPSSIPAWTGLCVPTYALVPPTVTTTPTSYHYPPNANHHYTCLLHTYQTATCQHPQPVTFYCGQHPFPCPLIPVPSFLPLGHGFLPTNFIIVVSGGRRRRGSATAYHQTERNPNSHRFHTTTSTGQFSFWQALRLYTVHFSTPAPSLFLPYSCSCSIGFYSWTLYLFLVVPYHLDHHSFPACLASAGQQL